MTQSFIAEQVFPKFCTQICSGCGIATAAVRLKNCAVVQLDVWLQMSMESSPAEVARNLQKTVDDFVDNDLVKRVRVRRGHAANKKD